MFCSVVAAATVVQDLVVTEGDHTADRSPAAVPSLAANLALNHAANRDQSLLAKNIRASLRKKKKIKAIQVQSQSPNQSLNQGHDQDLPLVQNHDQGPGHSQGHEALMIVKMPPQ